MQVLEIVVPMHTRHAPLTAWQVSVAVLLAPVTFLGHIRSTPLRTLARLKADQACTLHPQGVPVISYVVVPTYPLQYAYFLLAQCMTMKPVFHTIPCLSSIAGS